MKRVFIGIVCALALLLCAGIAGSAQSQQPLKPPQQRLHKKTKKRTEALPGKLDINSATQAELETLTGIAPATSASTRRLTGINTSENTGWFVRRYVLESKISPAAKRVSNP
jgi:hypothetical protein